MSDYTKNKLRLYLEYLENKEALGKANYHKSSNVNQLDRVREALCYVEYEDPNISLAEIQKKFKFYFHNHFNLSEV